MNRKTRPETAPESGPSHSGRWGGVRSVGLAPSALRQVSNLTAECRDQIEHHTLGELIVGLPHYPICRSVEVFNR